MPPSLPPLNLWDRDSLGRAVWFKNIGNTPASLNQKCHCKYKPPLPATHLSFISLFADSQSASHFVSGDQTPFFMTICYVFNPPSNFTFWSLRAVEFGQWITYIVEHYMYLCSLYDNVQNHGKQQPSLCGLFLRHKRGRIFGLTLKQIESSHEYSFNKQASIIMKYMQILWMLISQSYFYQWVFYT